MRRSVAIGAMLLGILLVPGMSLAQPSTARDGTASAVAQALDARDDTVEAFYAARDFRAAWHDARRVEALAEALRGLAADGLDPADYGAERLLADHRRAREAGDQAMGRFETATTRTLLTALRHLHHGKVDPRRVDPDWEVPIDERLPPMVAIEAAVAAGEIAALFDRVRPSYAPYERLRQGLSRYRELQRLGGWPRLPESPTLRPGDVHPDVARLRERLVRGGEMAVAAADASILPGATLEAPDPERFDAELEGAVKRFQRRHLLEVDGIVGPQTRAALNVPVGRRIDQIRLNLERARWLMHGLPEAFVLVDIAGYRLAYFRPNGETWRSRIVVGRPYRRTPSLRSRITHLTVNPTWTVPPTILREDVIPKVRRDPDYLARQNMQVITPSGQRLAPWQVDWSNPGNVMIRQSAGPDNALGQVVVRFPNDHLVYLHDTPAQGLFAREQRAFSSGCIRVQGVIEFAQLLLDDSGSERDLRALLAEGRTRNVPLAEPMPVVLHYWTVHPDPAGHLEFRPDIYQRDDALLRALDRPLSS